jgi:hypothetical protein
MVAEHRTVHEGMGGGSQRGDGARADGHRRERGRTQARRGRDRVAGVVEATRIGQHRIWLEDGLVVARLVGPFTGVDAPPFHAFLDEVFAASGPLFMLADMAAMSGFEAEARRYTAAWNAKRRIGAVALIGTSTAVRVMASLLVRAIQVVNRRPPAPVEFFKDEAEARRWLTAKRAERVA